MFLMEIKYKQIKKCNAGINQNMHTFLNPCRKRKKTLQYSYPRNPGNLMPPSAGQWNRPIGIGFSEYATCVFYNDDRNLTRAASFRGTQGKVKTSTAN